jgi:uncharacterized membrane protein YhaH (DUF805 family)
MDFLLSFDGRSGRFAYWMFAFVWLLIWLAFLLGPLLLSSMIGISKIGSIGFILLLLVTVISSFAITVRRLHDLDLSGWVILIMIFLGILNFGLYIYREFVVDVSQAFFLTFLITGLSIFLHTYYVLLMIWPGTDGANRYG